MLYFSPRILPYLVCLLYQTSSFQKGPMLRSKRLLNDVLRYRYSSTRLLDISRRNDKERFTIYKDATEDVWDKWEYGTFPSRHQTALKIQRIKEQLQSLQPTPELQAVNNANTSSNNADELDEWKASKFDPFWSHLNDSEVSDCIALLSPCMSEDRLTKFIEIMSQRTDSIRFIFENPSNTNNIWAALRTLDAFGIQFVDIIFNEEVMVSYWKKNMMRTALGSQKWMTFTTHESNEACLGRLKEEGYLIVATDLQEYSLKCNDIHWKDLLTVPPPELQKQSQQQRKLAIVMGNEGCGISASTRKYADHLIYMPMKGFAESLNLSVTVAVLCTQLEQYGVLQPSMDASTQQRILLTWISRSVKGAASILRKHAAVDMLE